MWQQPKTDWQAGDFFNVGDYNRIKGNLEELRSMALSLWPEFTIQDMGADKTYADYGFYADEFNRFEENIDLICNGTYPFPVGERKTFRDNQRFVDWEELNRIEGACLTIYLNIVGRHNGISRLSFPLGIRSFGARK